MNDWSWDGAMLSLIGIGCLIYMWRSLRRLLVSQSSAGQGCQGCNRTVCASRDEAGRE